MAGLGRRSHYRKHLTDAVLHDYPEPTENECIAKVVATRGGNQFDVLVAGNDTPQLAILPSKFNKLIWVKRGDYCIVETGDDDAQDSTSGGVRYLITHILYKEQIKHLKAKKLWPGDIEFQTLEGGTADDRKQRDEEAKWTSGEEDEEEQDDGIVYDTGVDDEFFVNTNRVNAMQIQESSESESSNEDGDTQQQETDDGIVYDTGDDELFANTNRVAALRIEESESESSEDVDDIQRQETEDGIVYDTGDDLNTSRLTKLQIQGSESDSGDDHDDDIRQQETDCIVFDTGDAEEVVDPSAHQKSDDSDDESNGIGPKERSGSLEFDTGRLGQEEGHKKSDDSDDESNDIGPTETSDSLVYDTGKVGQEEGDGIFYDTGKDEQEQADGNGDQQKSVRNIV